MIVRIRKAGMVAATAALMAACGPALHAPTEADASRGASLWAGYGLKDLSEGHRLYILKCSSCHALYRPRELSDKDWTRLFPEMSGKAHLSENESELILKYLTVMASADRGASSSR